MAYNLRRGIHYCKASFRKHWNRIWCKPLQFLGQWPTEDCALLPRMRRDDRKNSWNGDSTISQLCNFTPVEEKGTVAARHLVQWPWWSIPQSGRDATTVTNWAIFYEIAHEKGMREVVGLHPRPDNTTPNRSTQQEMAWSRWKLRSLTC